MKILLKIRRKMDAGKVTSVCFSPKSVIADKANN